MTRDDALLILYFLKRVVVRGTDEDLLLSLVDRLETEVKAWQKKPN